MRHSTSAKDYCDVVFLRVWRFISFNWQDTRVWSSERAWKASMESNPHQLLYFRKLLLYRPSIRHPYCLFGRAFRGLYSFGLMASPWL
ncbi:hypothetical protein VTI28DRAFT_1564 [Corynascus sepedonium]